jgi:SpoVK/Ycf46/Vps4 family AAA+-type ATPase
MARSQPTADQQIASSDLAAGASTAPGFANEPDWTDLYTLTVQRSAQATQQALSAGFAPHLQKLAAAFHLDSFDLDLFLLVLLRALNPSIGRVFAYLQDDANLTDPTVNMTLDVLCSASDLSRLTMLSHFAPGAPLFRHGLLVLGSEPRALPTPLLSQSLGVDPTVVAWLLGDYQPHATLGAHVEVVLPHSGINDELVAAEVWPQIADLGADSVLLAFYGPDQESQSAAARLFAEQRGQPLLTVDLPGLLKAGTTPATALRFALRDARLTGAIPFLSGLDACLDAGFLPSALAALLAEHPATLITSSVSRWRAARSLGERLMIEQAFPLPGYAQRRALWSHYLGKPIADTVDVAALASQFALDSGRIRAVASAVTLAAQRRGDPTLRIEEIFAAARDDSTSRLGDLAYKIRPRHGWEDLVLPQEKMAVLREMVAMVRSRPKVLDQWGVINKLAPSRAVTALFAGEPGTGKTIAAEVIASDLGLDIYKIDLSSLVDKYIGETEKNLERIFTEAESANAILFFDEADAIFGKRTGVKDAHDRYANVGVSYLLQRMESFDGITILATNLRANLDDAFTRRLHFALDFPFPDAVERLRIWQALFPPDLPAAQDLDLAWLAQRFKLAGGSIRNIIVSAAYLAADAGEEVSMNHLLHGARRELQKMGRLSIGDVEEYARHVAAENAENGSDTVDNAPRDSNPTATTVVSSVVVDRTKLTRIRTGPVIVNGR